MPLNRVGSHKNARQHLTEYRISIPAGGTLTVTETNVSQMRDPNMVLDRIQNGIVAQARARDAYINRVLGIPNGNSNHNRVCTRVGFTCLQFPSDLQRA